MACVGESCDGLRGTLTVPDLLQYASKDVTRTVAAAPWQVGWRALVHNIRLPRSARSTPPPPTDGSEHGPQTCFGPSRCPSTPPAWVKSSTRIKGACGHMRSVDAGCTAMAVTATRPCLDLHRARAGTCAMTSLPSDHIGTRHHASYLLQTKLRDAHTRLGSDGDA